MLRTFRTGEVAVIMVLVLICTPLLVSAQGTVLPDIRGPIKHTVAQAEDGSKERGLIRGMPHAYLWSALGLGAGGLASLIYSGKDANCHMEPPGCIRDLCYQACDWSKTKHGYFGAGIGALVGAGVLVKLGLDRGKRQAPSITIGPGGFAVGYRVRF